MTVLTLAGIVALVIGGFLFGVGVRPLWNDWQLRCRAKRELAEYRAMLQRELARRAWTEAHPAHPVWRSQPRDLN